MKGSGDGRVKRRNERVKRGREGEGLRGEGR